MRALILFSLLFATLLARTRYHLIEVEDKNEDKEVGRNEDEKAKSLIDTLNDQGYQSMQREWVEPSTLRAFIREQHEAGKELPMDLLGAFVGQKTTIKD